MSDKEWRRGPYSAQAKAESIQNFEARRAAERAEELHNARYCQCHRPRRLRVYLKWWKCALCQRLIYRPELDTDAG